MIPYRNLIIVTQVLSVAITLSIVLSGFQLNVSEKMVESVGGSMSTALLMVGIICHFQARRKTPHMGMLALLGCFAPAYALLDEPGRYLFGFHLVALGFHGMVLYSLHKIQKEKDAPS